MLPGYQVPASRASAGVTHATFRPTHEMSPRVTRSFSFLCWPDQVVWEGAGGRWRSHTGAAWGSCLSVRPEHLLRAPHSGRPSGKAGTCGAEAGRPWAAPGLCTSGHEASASHRRCELRLPPCEGGHALRPARGDPARRVSGLEMVSKRLRTPGPARLSRFVGFSC